MSKIEIEEGMVLEQDTCDEIWLDLNGNSKRINPHTEHLLVKDVSKEYITLYNLDTQRTHKIKKDDMKYYIIGGIYKMSNEVA